MNEIDQQEMVRVISEFIELGHVENIVAMFEQDPSYYSLTAELISDERFMVRMGVAVLFDELKERRPEDIALAVPTLLPLLDSKTAYIRGEAVSLLATIGSRQAIAAISPLKNDADPQVAEIVSDFLKEKIDI